MSSNVLREISIWPRYCQDGDDNQRGENLFCGENLLQSNLSQNGSSTFARHNVDMDTRLLLRNLLRQESNDILSIEQTFGYSFDSWQGNKGLKAYMRGIVVTWMHEVCSAEICDEQVFHLSCRYLDLLVRHKSKMVCKSNLQKFAAVCMSISSKLKQTKPISLLDLCEYTDYSVHCDQIRESEMEALEMLGWEISLATPQSFLDLLLGLFKFKDKEKIRRHALTFIDLSAFYREFTDVKPSVLACASLLSSIAGLMIETGEDMSSRLGSLISCDKNLLCQCQSSLEKRFAEESCENVSVCGKVKEHAGALENHPVGHDPLLTPKNDFKIELSSATPPTIADIVINDRGFVQKT